jgi:hypothetical protein
MDRRCDDQSIRDSLSFPQRTLQKKHNAACFHKVREAGAMNVIRVAKIDGSWKTWQICSQRSLQPSQELGKLITKAETACFASESSCPLSNGIENSDTGSLTEFFEAIEDVSCDTSWDAPVNSKETALSSCILLDNDREKDLSKRITLMIMIPLSRMSVQRFLETTCERMKSPGSSLPLLGLWQAKPDVWTFLLFPKAFDADCTCNPNNTKTIWWLFLVKRPSEASCVPEGLAPEPEEVLIPLRLQISAD